MQIENETSKKDNNNRKSVAHTTVTSGGAGGAGAFNGSRSRRCFGLPHRAGHVHHTEAALQRGGVVGRQGCVVRVRGGKDGAVPHHGMVRCEDAWDRGNLDVLVPPRNAAWESRRQQSQGLLHAQRAYRQG